MGLSFYTLVSFDYKYCYASIQSYYPIADEIILVIDKDRITWNQNKFELNKEEFQKRLKEIDVDHKIKIVEDNFHQEQNPITNHTNERNFASRLCRDGNYIVAIDSDEIVLNAQDFLQWYNMTKPEQDIEATIYTIFKTFETKLLITEPFEKVVIATKNKNSYTKFRNTQSAKIFSPLKILNYSWGRTHEEVIFKVKNWNYSNVIDQNAFLTLWRTANRTNYSDFSYFHPMKINSLYKSLKLVDITKFGLTIDIVQSLAFKNEKVSIVIPVKNQFKIVELCLRSVEKYCSKFDVCLVDDGSTEEQTIKMLQDYVKRNTDWHLIINEESKGHSKACEAGIEHTICENIFLLNSDTILTLNSIKILNGVLNNNIDIAVVGSTTSSATGIQLNQEAHVNRFKWNTDQIEQFALNIEKDKAVEEIELVNGFCFGIKRSVFNLIGGFDKNLSCYGNEKELLIRIRKAGYKTCWVKGSYIHHFGKMSYSKSDVNIGQAQLDADRYIRRKHPGVL